MSTLQEDIQKYRTGYLGTANGGFHALLEKLILYYAAASHENQETADKVAGENRLSGKAFHVTWED